MDKNETNQNKMVETLAGDMAEVLENDPGGLVKKIIHGEEEHEKEKMNMSPESRINKIFLIMSVIFTILALGIVSYFFLNPVVTTVPVAKQFVPIIFNDQFTYLEVDGIDKDQIAQSVLNEVNNTSVQSGGLEGIYLTENKQMIGLRRFISLIKSSFAPNTNPVLVSDSFLMGAVNAAGSPGFFILLKVRSSADIFDALRAWEVGLLTDLHGFLGINIGSDTNYLFSKNFEDGIVENKNARMLYDKEGNLVVMYIFADDNSVIITNSQGAAHEVMLRLAGNQPQK